MLLLKYGKKYSPGGKLWSIVKNGKCPDSPETAG
jgi:hypothetical protein